MLIDCAADILVHYPDFAAGTSTISARNSKKPTSITSEREDSLLSACGYDGATFDDIVRRVGLTATEVSSILSALEVRGLVRSLAGNSYLRIDA
jgi:predicted Rossmann fold nucleotide-binding protein DprA/Smf involved in DNA uptake